MLKPQEYYYLYSPSRLDPVELIRYTFQSLCLQGFLSIHVEYVLVSPRDTKKRKRYYFRLNEMQNSSSLLTAEKVIIGLFEDSKELRVYQVNNRLKQLLGEDPYNFKVYVWKDIQPKGYFWLGSILSKKGRAAKKECAGAIDTFEASFDALLQNEEKLLVAINELGTNLIFLDAKTLSRLKKFTKEHLLNPETERENKVGRLESIHVLKTIVVGDFSVPIPLRKRGNAFRKYY